MQGHMAKATERSYAIVGAGVFGASAALHLARKYPSAKISLIDREDFPCQVGASWDWNKVVRADYDDIRYMRLALEAKKIWRTDPLFQEWYHEDGMYWISDTKLAQTVIEFYQRLGADEDYELLPTDKARTLYNRMFDDADYTGVSEVLVNRSSGWADAKKALKAVVQAAVDAGVEYIPATVESLEFHIDGACKGLRLVSGSTLSAGHVILCTGAATAKLLADSAPDRRELQVGDRMTAAAICTGLIKLDARHAETFRGPVCCQDLFPGRGGTIPPNSDNELKIWRDIPYKNSVKHASGGLISMPPDKPDYGQWDITPSMKAEVRQVGESIFGKRMQDMKIEQHRICWEATTPNEDFVICPHPHCRNLFVATAGSFHGWKFLPILGKYVTQMLEGVLDEDLARVWAWDRDNGSSAPTVMWPKRELRDAALSTRL